MVSTINIFLSSTSEVAIERQAIQDAVDQINRQEAFGDVELQLVRYDDIESGIPLDANLPPQKTIDVKYLSPDRCDIVLGVFDRIFGTPPGEEFRRPDGTAFQSGTEYELYQAFTGYQDNGYPAIVIYKRERDAAEMEPELNQYLSNLKLPSESARGIQFYRSVGEFKKRIALDITTLIHEAQQNQPVQSPTKISRFVTEASNDTNAIVGRGDDFRKINNAFLTDGLGIFIIHGERGVGKTEFAKAWAENLRRGLDAAIIAYSFNEPSELGTGDAFFHALFDELGLVREPGYSSLVLAEKAFEGLCQSKHVLVLDGIEHLVDPNNDTLRDDGIRFLMDRIGRECRVVCILTSAVPIELGAKAFSLPLKRISNSAGVRLLESKGVWGPRSEMEAAVERWRGHPLSLVHLAAELKRYGYRIERSHLFESNLDFSANLNSTERFRLLIEIRCSSLSEEERQLLFVLAVFGDPVSLSELVSIASQFSEGTSRLSSQYIFLASNELASEALVVFSRDRNALQLAHPLLQDYFWHRGQEEDLEAWQALHFRIAERRASLVRGVPAKPSECRTVESIVRHHIFSGNAKRALDDFYIPLLKVDFAKSHNLRVLGTFDSDLFLLRLFFDEPWFKLVSEIPDEHLGDLSYEAAFCLRASGRLDESVFAFSDARNEFQSRGKMQRAAEVSGDMALTCILVGDFDEALLHANHAIQFADQSQVSQERIRQRSNAVLVETVRGDLDRGHVLVRESEAIANELDEQIPLWSFWFEEFSIASGTKLPSCLSSADHATSMTATPNLDSGLKNLIVAKRLFCSLLAEHHLPIGPANSFDEGAACRCIELLELANDGLKRANTDHHKPRVWLAMARLSIFIGDFNGAVSQLERVEMVSRICGMRIYLYETAFLRLCLDYSTDRLQEFSSRLLIVRESFEQGGYGCRIPHLDKLKKLFAQEHGVS